ncbi:hypothetical protein C8R47DRAFT_1063040 [Mycena vitilis]|nr:hypothetical protein C8R47DRAFT_1063040 [Mycena vitilis]
MEASLSIDKLAFIDRLDSSLVDPESNGRSYRFYRCPQQCTQLTHLQTKNIGQLRLNRLRLSQVPISAIDSRMFVRAEPGKAMGEKCRHGPTARPRLGAMILSARWFKSNCTEDSKIERVHKKGRTCGETDTETLILQNRWIPTAIKPISWVYTHQRVSLYPSWMQQQTDINRRRSVRRTSIRQEKRTGEERQGDAVRDREQRRAVGKNVKLHSGVGRPGEKDPEVCTGRATATPDKTRGRMRLVQNLCTLPRFAGVSVEDFGVDPSSMYLLSLDTVGKHGTGGVAHRVIVMAGEGVTEYGNLGWRETQAGAVVDVRDAGGIGESMTRTTAGCARILLTAQRSA